VRLALLIGSLRHSIVTGLCSALRCAHRLRTDHAFSSTTFTGDPFMFTKLFAASLLSLGFVLTGAAVADQKPRDCCSAKVARCNSARPAHVKTCCGSPNRFAQVIDCCSAKLACCAGKSACCDADSRLGCCESGRKCCADNKGCCAAAQNCCAEGSPCCDATKSCCGKHHKKAA
jgi:hypothetical protein